MIIRVASYNLWHHKAYGELADIAQNHNPDVFCLQECHPDQLDDRLGALKLADAQRYVHRLPLTHRPSTKNKTSSVFKGNVGIALYYNPNRLHLDDMERFELPLPWQERSGGRIVQIALFTAKISGERFVVVNVHLSALLAPNRARRRQLQEVLDQITQQHKTTPVILAGDFNYPIADQKLRNQMAAHGLKECGTLDASPTHISKLVKGKFDRIFISNSLEEKGYTILQFGASDHAPITARIKL